MQAPGWVVTEPRPRVGLLGGTFDPVHNAHIALAHAALSDLVLERVLWLPAGQPWQKVGRVMAPAEHRVAMVRLAIAGEPRFAIDESELTRTGPSYTIDTVDALRAARPDIDFVLVIGQDQYARLDTWHEWRSLLACVVIAVAVRDARRVMPPPALAGVSHRVETLTMPPLAISSTEIRARVARGEPIDAMVPPAVAGYIASHQLYRGAAGH